MGWYSRIVDRWRGKRRREEREAEEADWDRIELLSDVQSCTGFFGYVVIVGCGLGPSDSVVL